MIPLLNAGSAAIKEQAEEARKLGIVIGDDFARNAEKFNDNLTKLKLGAKGVVNEIVADMLPTLSNLSAIFAKAGIESRSFISKGIETLAIGQFGAAFKGLELAAAKVASLLGLANQTRSAGSGDLQTFATREQTLHSMLAANDAILRSVQANTLTSPSDRREASIGVLRDELKQLIELEKIATDNLPGPITTGNAEGLQVKTQERIDAEKKLYDVQRQRIDVTAKLIELDRETFSGKMLENLQALAKDWGNLGVQMADGFKNTFMSAVDTISDGITGLITGTLTWAQALRQIGTNILTEIVHSIVQVGVRWIATQFLMAATGQAVLASTLAITAPIAAAQSAIWAVPATLSTIASYGASAEAAPAFVLQSLAESLGALAGFSGGGFTGLGNTSQPAGVVHGGEFVFSAPATSRLGVDNLESLHQAALSPSVNVQGHSVVNVMVRDQSELRDFLKSRAGRDEIVNIVRTYRTEIGIA
jgi:hypothetical protein